MANNNFPPLLLSSWQPTRDTLNIYAKIIGKVRRALTPHQKHWWHVSLRTTATGLTTTPMPAGALSVEIRLDLVNHLLIVENSRGEVWHCKLEGQSPAQFCATVLTVLQHMGVTADIDRSEFADDEPHSYDPLAVTHFWQTLTQIDGRLKEFKGEQRRETSPVQIWPHHFDLSMIWLSGRLVPDTDPEDEEYSDEQMNFGFSTGDEGIPEPYFYITAYPMPAGLTETQLPPDAQWLTEGFMGAVMMYAALVDTNNPGEKLLDFWRTVHKSGSQLMT